MKMEDLVEKVAITIFQLEGGVGPDEFKEVFGHTKPNWKNTHDFQKDQDQLAEHERDEFRIQARAVILRLLDMGVIEIKTRDKK